MARIHGCVRGHMSGPENRLIDYVVPWGIVIVMIGRAVPDPACRLCP
jgi:hypothetical protein